MIASIIGLLAAQVVAALLVVAIRLGEGGRKFDLESFQTDGLLISLSMIFSTPVTLALCWLFVRLRRGATVKEYLGLRPFGWKDTVLGIGALVALWGLNAWINPEPSPWVVRTYKNAGPLPLFWLSIVVLAPLVEEVMFRGFALPGLSKTPLGSWGAIGITTVAWSALHVQYGWRELVFVAGLGLVFGWLRARSGSLWLPMALHALNNLASTVIMHLSLSEM